jgi:hypothetical protein
VIWIGVNTVVEVVEFNAFKALISGVVKVIISIELEAVISAAFEQFYLMLSKQLTEVLPKTAAFIHLKAVDYSAGNQ